MGLVEKRAVETLKSSVAPVWQKRIDDAAGFQIGYEINWDKLMKEGYASSYEEFFNKVYFQPIEEAVKAVAVDQMGKEALKNGLKKVVITNSSDYISPNHFSFHDGTLTLDHDPSTNVDDVKERVKVIQKLLEEKLS